MNINGTNVANSSGDKILRDALRAMMGTITFWGNAGDTISTAGLQRLALWRTCNDFSRPSG